MWILPRAFRLGRNAVHILLQAAPSHVDLDALCRDLLTISSVVDVHDLHAWTLTSEMEAASAHLVVVDTNNHRGGELRLHFCRRGIA